MNIQSEKKSIYTRIQLLKYNCQKQSMVSQLPYQNLLSFSQIKSNISKIYMDIIYWGLISAIFRRIIFARYSIKVDKISENIILDLFLPAIVVHYSIFKISQYNDMYFQHLDDQGSALQQNLLDSEYQKEKELLQNEYKKKFWTNSQYWH